PGSKAGAGLTSPEPMSNVVASTPARWIGLPALSFGSADVMRADLTSMGSQSGCFDRSNAATPAMCGAAIDVPDSLSHRLPEWFSGDTAATTLTPGAMMSGLPRSPRLNSDGPADEKPATCGASTLVVTLAENDAVGLPVEWMYDLIARPCVLLTCTVGTKWKSASSSCAALTL